jgi:hypothetical protein
MYNSFVACHHIPSWLPQPTPTGVFLSFFLTAGNKAERLHLAHLRRLLGVRQGTPTAVVLTETGVRPLWQRWLLRAVKLWKLAVTAEQSSLLWQAMTAGVALTVAPGHRIPAW